MSAEGTPQIERSPLARGLAAIARLAIRYPWLTLAIGVVVAVAALALSTARLRYNASRSALISNRSEFQQFWLEYVKEFDENEDVVVVVQGASREAMAPVLEEIAERISREGRYFYSVLHDNIDPATIRAKGLYYLPASSVQAIDRSLDELGPILQGDWSMLNPGAMAGVMASGMAAVQGNADEPLARRPGPSAQEMAALQARLSPMCEMLGAAFDPSGQYRSPWPEMPGAEALAGQGMSDALRKPNGRFGFVALKLADEDSRGLTENAVAVAALRKIVADARARHPDFQIGLTGLPIMEHDEMQSSQSSMTVATILSYLGVLVVLVAGFGGLRHSLLTMGALSLGMVWSLGYTTLALGHLNILSSAFGAILSGLGIDYGTYYAAKYLQFRKAGYDTPNSLVGTAGTVGAGITIGAVGTAVAFFMSGFTEFVGVAELGIVAGGGIVLCWLAAMTVLPAVLKLSDSRRSAAALPTPLDFHLWLTPVLTRPRAFLIAGLATTLVLSLGMTRLWYDYNLLNMQPAGLESVVLEQKLLNEAGESAYFAISIADTPQEALDRKAKFLKLDASVERVDEIASLVPAELDQKRPIIQRIAQRLARLPSEAPRIPVLPQEQLAPMLMQLRGMLAASPQTAAQAQQIGALAAAIGRMSSGEYHARLSGYVQRAAGELLARLHALRAVANPEPPGWGDLPKGLVDRFVGRTGKLALRVYGKGNLWDPVATDRFISDVRKVDPKITGNPIQVSESARVMKQSYEQAAIYALLIILPVVFLDFGSIRDTLLALLPLGLGIIQLFGLMGYLDMALNPANTIALPLMLGMGIDNGVHIVHDFRSQRGRYRMSHSTSVAVVLNTVTTMVGFAVLMIADHRGVQGLGRVLTLGMACCLLSSLAILPAILVLMTRRRESADRSDEQDSLRSRRESAPEEPLRRPHFSRQGRPVIRRVSPAAAQRRV